MTKAYPTGKAAGRLKLDGDEASEPVARTVHNLRVY